MTLAVNDRLATRRTSLLASPLAILAGAVALACVLLLLPIAVPIGPMYWDTYVYYDGAQRIFDGQIPIIDYFAPVGPLGYYIFAGWLAVFPDGQPALMAHWALLVLTAPLMGLVIWQLEARSRASAWALLIPFLIFSLLPFNGREFYPFPSSDGFGIYNRQVCQLLYVLVAALLFVRNQRALATIVAVSVTALFFLKITGFVAAGLICLFALVAGRITIRQAAAAALAFAAVLAASELAVGMVSLYIADIESLVAANSGTLLPRIVQSISINIDIVGTTLALCLVLAIAQRQKLGEALRGLLQEPGLAALYKLADRDVFWLGAVIVAGVFFEAQNTGSQAFIFVWPVLWSVLTKLPSQISRPKIALLSATLVAAVYLPMVVGILERTLRTYAGAIQTTRLENHNLRALGEVTTRDYVQKRAELMLALYPKQQPQLAEIASNQELPAPLLYSDLDFQITNLMAIDHAVDSIRALEARTGAHFQTMMTLAFANPFPYLMKRSAPRLISIGADPFRAVPNPSKAVLKEVAAVDIALYPKCPNTWANVRLLQIYGPALKDHRKIELDDCFTAYVNPRLADKVGG